MDALAQEPSNRAFGGVPATLLDTMKAAGIAGLTWPFVPLGGGRTNKLWRFGPPSGYSVCKLYRTDAGTPLFPNDPGAEALALDALSGTGLAPNPGLLLQSPVGPCLIYRYIKARSQKRPPEAVGRLMARLHAQAPPNGLRRLCPDPEQILAMADRMLSGLSNQKMHLLALRPKLPAMSSEDADDVFLHGDIVPGNLILAHDGLRLIDWQCPAIGDPTSDIAIYLSPAMQYVNREAGLAPEDEARFLAAYDHPKRSNRYVLLRPAYHYRMAAYCLWKAERGDAAYSTAADLEMARLKLVNQN